MSEPYNDEEIEEVKDWLINAPPNSNRRWMNGEWIVYERLIATVESLKWVVADKTGTIVLQGKMLRERDDLIMDPEYLKLKEQNAKFKEDARIVDQFYSKLKKENAKLAMELEAALKRIEEME